MSTSFLSATHTYQYVVHTTNTLRFNIVNLELTSYLTMNEPKKKMDGQDRSNGLFKFFEQRTNISSKNVGLMLTSFYDISACY